MLLMLIAQYQEHQHVYIVNTNGCNEKLSSDNAIVLKPVTQDYSLIFLWSTMG